MTKGFRCVDIRKFFRSYGATEPSPTRQGLAIRIHEWLTWVKIMTAINDEYPDLATALPCFYSSDHNNLLSALCCTAGVSNTRPAGRMRSAKLFCAARGAAAMSTKFKIFLIIATCIIHFTRKSIIRHIYI